MKPEEPTYTIGEISLATGLKPGLLSARRKNKGIPAAPRGGVYLGPGERDGPAAAAKTGH